MNFEVIDFHTHPFLHADERIGQYYDILDYSYEDTVDVMNRAGVSAFCGSVIGGGVTDFDGLKERNRNALRLRDIYGDRYIPGFHVHPDYVEESIAEIDFARSEGVRLIGELVPYAHGWTDYTCRGFAEILDYLQSFDLPVSLHNMDLDGMEKMAKAYPSINFVFAHPGQRDRVERHIQIMKSCDNVWLDLSGSGLDNMGVLKHLTDSVGAERIVFGSDYPVCNTAMYVGAVLAEKLPDSQKELILSGNAKRLLRL